MIWFILGTLIPLALGILWYNFKMMEVDEWQEIFAVWAFGSFFGALVAIVINLVLGLVLPNQEYDQTHALAEAPAVVRTDLGLEVMVTTTDRENFYDEGTDLKFIDSNDNTVTIRDYVVYNGWLSVINFADDDMIIRIPESEVVSLGR